MLEQGILDTKSVFPDHSQHIWLLNPFEVTATLVLTFPKYLVLHTYPTPYCLCVAGGGTQGFLHAKLK